MHLLLFIAAYLLGSIPFAVIISKLFGLADPRGYGSGNPGATNVLRSGNRIAAALTLLGDALKGLLAVYVAGALGFSPFEAALAGFAAFLGHLFSIFLRFKGGKGVATALGVLLGINVWVALSALGAWLIVILMTRYSSLSALVAALITPIAGIIFLGDTPRILVLVAIAVLLTWRHRDNIRKLCTGQENKVGSRQR